MKENVDQFNFINFKTKCISVKNTVKRIEKKKQATVWEKKKKKPAKHLSDNNMDLKYTADKKYVR